MALGNAHGQHIPRYGGGINGEGADPGSKRLCGRAPPSVDSAPGFIVSLTGYCMSIKNPVSQPVDAMNGNICRCTGHKSAKSRRQG